MNSSPSNALADTVADAPRGREPTLDAPSEPTADASTRVVDSESLVVTREHPGRYTGPRRRGLPPAEHPIELGRGGIGRVLIAHDAHIGREVAVKELLPRDGADRGAAMTPPTRPDSNPRHSLAAARFLREARLTGQLEHPNIVPIYELGQRTDGTLYYTMKVVRGKTMSDALAVTRSLEERLKLLKHYADLCDAIAYAHSKGVIHRDIKPENVMTGEFGETVVLDWGLAKSKDGKDLTGNELARAIESLALAESADLAKTSDGTLLGTPLFMSPEQAQGLTDEVDERSDVWALGVVLYELLTGTTPFTGKTAVELLIAICKNPLVPVRERESSAPPELAAIAEKALRKNPDDRYPDARALAEEVRAYLTGGRVRAYEYRAWELFKRWAGRHKAALAVAAFATVALLGLGIFSYVEIRGERDTAMVAKVEAETARARAETAEGEATSARHGAEGLVRFMLDDLQKKLEPLGQTSLLDGVARAVQEYHARDADKMDAQPTTEADVTRLRNRAGVVALLGDLARTKGDLEAAAKAYAQAERWREMLVAARPRDGALAAELAESIRRRGLLLRMQGKLPQSAAALEEARTRRQALLESDPTSLEAARATLESALDVGAVASLMGEPDKALVAFKKAVEAANALALAHDEPEVRHDLSLALDALGTALLDARDLDQADATFQRSLTIREQLVTEAPHNAAWQHRLATIYGRLGEIAGRRGDTAKARERWGESAALMERLVKQDPANARWLRDLAVNWNRVADLELGGGRVTEAVHAYRRSLDAVLSLASRDPTNFEILRDVEVGHNRVGDALVMAGQMDKALDEFQEGLAIADQLARHDNTNAQWRHDYALSTGRVALARWRQGDSEGALPLQEQSLKLYESLVASDPNNKNWVKDRDAAQATLETMKRGQGDVPIAGPAEQQQYPAPAAKAQPPQEQRPATGGGGLSSEPSPEQ